MIMSQQDSSAMDQSRPIAGLQQRPERNCFPSVEGYPTYDIKKLQSSDIEATVTLDGSNSLITTEFWIFAIPKHLQYNPSDPFIFSYTKTGIYSVATMLIVANLYYCQPLLIQISMSFGVSYEDVARIPTCVQAGYAVGLFLICPLGDIIRRRQLVLALILCTTLLTIGLAVTSSVVIFEALSFIIGLANVAPQILIPLVAEIAPADIRAFAFSLVLTGLMFGILLARVLAGLIAQFLAWRVVYYAAICIQALVFGGLYFTLPDYPAKGADAPSWRLHWSTLVLAVTEPIAVQVIVINLGASACFSYYWVTLTFLLGEPPYEYSTLEIGLFGLIGIAGVAVAPISGRLVDYILPWHSLLLSISLLLVFQSVQVAAGGIHISAVIISCFGSDLVQQAQSVALATYIFSISKEAISRLNALYMISFYVGQIMGTSIGTSIFIRYGWRASTLFGLGLYGLQLCALLVRGHRRTWVGYQGGISVPNKISEHDQDETKQGDIEKESM